MDDSPPAGEVRGRSLRFDASDVLSVTFGGCHPAIPVHDISRGGFSIQTSRRFSVGSLYSVWLAAESGPRVALIARVAHTRTPSVTGLITGFEFMETQLPATSHQLDQLIAAVMNRGTEVR
jgi:hypothetical protein